ncbi:MAG: DUF4350 domain-containing protein [Polyangia bacterium]|nr:DUF4350 domain-containing protein [Polyangia bacterium]
MARFRPRVDWLWPLAVLAVVLGALLWLPTPSGGEADSRSTLPRGKKAFFQWVESLEPDVQRSMSGLVPPDKPAGQTLLVLGPARYPKPDEWARLKAWVEVGNTLVFAARYKTPKVDLAPFPVEVLPGNLPDMQDLLGKLGGAGASKEGSGDKAEDGTQGDKAGKQAKAGEQGDKAGKQAKAGEQDDKAGKQAKAGEQGDKAGGDEEDGVFPKSKRRDPKGRALRKALRGLGELRFEEVETALVKGKARWASQASVKVKDDKAPSAPLVRLKKSGTLQAARIGVGKGALIVVASDEVFTNRTLVKGGPSRLLAYRLFEQRLGAGPVRFDELLNTTGTPQTVGLLLDPLFRPLTFQILLCALLFGWLGFRRFGPPKPPLAAPRRSIVEHAEALGNLQYRAQASGRAVVAYLEWWRSELHLEGGMRRQADLLQRLALVSGRSPGAIHNLLLEASQAEQLSMPPSRATVIIRELARLRAALRRDARPGGRP